MLYFKFLEFIHNLYMQERFKMDTPILLWKGIDKDLAYYGLFVKIGKLQFFMLTAQMFFLMTSWTDSQMSETETLTSWSKCVGDSVDAPHALQYSKVLAFIWPQREWLKGWGGWVEKARGAEQIAGRWAREKLWPAFLYPPPGQRWC